MKAATPVVAAVGVLALGLLVVALPGTRRRAATRRVQADGSMALAEPSSLDRSDPPAGVGAGRAPRWVARLLHDLALPVDPAAAWWGGLAVVVGCTSVGGLVGGPGLAVVALVGVVSLPVVAVGLGRGRRARLVDWQLPVALDRMGRALRAGTSLRSAFGTTAVGSPAPLAGELARVDAELAAGEPLAAVLLHWGDRCPTPGVRLLVAAATLGHEAGGAQARAIDGVAATLRERHAVQREARALASQARASAAVVVLAPVGFAVFSAATDPEVLAFLLGTGPGLACLVLALGLDVGAAVWMARITGSIR